MARPIKVLCASEDVKTELRRRIAPSPIRRSAIAAQPASAPLQYAAAFARCSARLARDN
jgi:hypothetical protein